VIFSRLLLLSPSLVQILSSAPCSQTPSTQIYECTIEQRIFSQFLQSEWRVTIHMCHRQSIICLNIRVCVNFYTLGEFISSVKYESLLIYSCIWGLENGIYLLKRVAHLVETGERICVMYICADSTQHRFTPQRARFDPRWGHLGFVVDKVALRHFFSEYFGFPIPILSPPTPPHSLIILSSILTASLNNKLKRKEHDAAL
jgi:hypothetical protein